MRPISVLAICAAALILVSCSAGLGVPPERAETTAPPSPTAPSQPDPAGAGTSIPLCETVEHISAPAEWYRDSPVYVANEMPTERVRAWAAGKPGFEELWIDRDHLGWITVAFSADAEARQAELEPEFPGVGVVAVGVDWTMAGLERLQRRVADEIGPLFPLDSSISVTQGVVTIGLGVLKEERVGAVQERFAGEPICLEGIDPSEAPREGPQLGQGDGWRLLVDQQGAGQPYRTGIAFDPASYRDLWTEIGLEDERPNVDFESEVVIWFGAVYGSSCPNLRLDDVVVDRERALVHAEIVLAAGPMACTADANPRAYLVAVERRALPAGPFAIQLDADGPPGGAPEERTLVEADLSLPGAVAEPGQVHGDPTLPEPFILESGSIIEPDVEYPYRLHAHCGIEWLGAFNDVAWRAEVPDVLDFVPPEWESAVDEGESVHVSMILRTGPAHIEATANGHTVTYLPSSEDPPGCD